MGRTSRRIWREHEAGDAMKVRVLAIVAEGPIGEPTVGGLHHGGQAQTLARARRQVGHRQVHPDNQLAVGGLSLHVRGQSLLEGSTLAVAGKGMGLTMSGRGEVEFAVGLAVGGSEQLEAGMAPETVTAPGSRGGRQA